MKIITNYLVYALMTAVVVSCGANAANNSSKDDKNTKREVTIKTIHLTKAEFLTKVVNYETNSKEWKYLGDKPAIIDFYATWCSPCKTLAPILEELAQEYDGQIYIYKIDTDKEQELSSAFGITSIPTLFFIPMGEPPQIAQGALPKANLKKIIDNVLLKKDKN
ncbi:MAG: thioredoxin [Rikenellaceae bacterium]